MRTSIVKFVPMHSTSKPVNDTRGIDDGEQNKRNDLNRVQRWKRPLRMRSVRCLSYVIACSSLTHRPRSSFREARMTRMKQDKNPFNSMIGQWCGPSGLVDWARLAWLTRRCVNWIVGFGKLETDKLSRARKAWMMIGFLRDSGLTRFDPLYRIVSSVRVRTVTQIVCYYDDL